MWTYGDFCGKAGAYGQFVINSAGGHWFDKPAVVMTTIFTAYNG